MTNTNCLENIVCPQCGHTDSFIIEVKTHAYVTDEGAVTFGHMQWDEWSLIQCKSCEAAGTVAEFTRDPDTLLPADPDGINDRAAWARAALGAFMRETGTEYEDSLCDLLCDLMHLCDRNKFDFEAALSHARNHYLAETGQPGPLTGRL